MKRMVITVSVLLALVMVLAGCGQSEFSMVINEDNTGVITAGGAPGDTLTAGSIILEEEETFYIEPALEGGAEINIKLIPSTNAGIDAEAEDLMESVDPKNAVLDVDINGTGPTECGLAPGEYMICATVVKGGTGTVLLRVGRASSPWTLAPSGEEAAAGAGLDKFEVPDGVETSLGPVVPLSFGYQDGVAEADLSTAAVEMRTRKGNAEMYPDVSFDENDYQYEWSRNIGDIAVKCYGNRDGEATKTVWTAGDYSYALLAYGAGGDDDYGLSVEDLDALVEKIK